MKLLIIYLIVAFVDLAVIFYLEAFTKEDHWYRKFLNHYRKDSKIVKKQYKFYDKHVWTSGKKTVLLHCVEALTWPIRYAGIILILLITLLITLIILLVGLFSIFIKEWLS